MTKIKLVVKGGDAAALSHEITTTFQDMFQAEVSDLPAPPQPTAKDSMAVAAWVGVALMVPPALIASLDLVERSKLRQRIAQLISKLRDTKTAEPNEVTVEIDNTSLNLKETEADKVFDLIANTSQQDPS